MSLRPAISVGMSVLILPLPHFPAQTGNAIPVGCSITSGLRVKSSTFVTEYQKCFLTTMVGPQKNRKRAIQ